MPPGLPSVVLIFILFVSHSCQTLGNVSFLGQSDWIGRTFLSCYIEQVVSGLLYAFVKCAKFLGAMEICSMDVSSHSSQQVLSSSENGPNKEVLISSGINQ